MNNYLAKKSFFEFCRIYKILTFFLIIIVSSSFNLSSSELDNLFLKLKESNNPKLARDYESKIWKLWLNNGSSEASNTQMKIGTIAHNIKCKIMLFLRQKQQVSMLL